MTEWISETEALARITILTGLQDPYDVFWDAISEGKIAAEKPKPARKPIPVSEAIRGDLNIYAGGFTAVDAEYDERLGEVLRIPQTRVSLSDVVKFAHNLAGTRPAHRPEKQENARKAYFEIYGEKDGHKKVGHQWKEVLRAVIEKTGVSISAESLRTALKD